MSFLEKNLEDIIFKNFDKCKERGLKIDHMKQGLLLRQVDLGDYGIADLITVSFECNLINGCTEIFINVIECKKGIIDTTAYLQGKRYITGLKELLFLSELDVDHYRINLKLQLIGSSFDERSDLKYLLHSDRDTQVFTYEYGFDGISFKEVDRFLFFKRTIGEREIKKMAPKIKQLHRAFYLSLADKISDRKII